MDVTGSEIVFKLEKTAQIRMICLIECVRTGGM